MNNSHKILHLFNECVEESKNEFAMELCEVYKLNWVEVADRFDLLNKHNSRTDYTPKNKRILKLPESLVRCEALSSHGDQCKRSKKDDTSYCRRHIKKQANGTIHTKKNVISEILMEEDLENEELEINNSGNIITLENNQEVIYIPSTNLCYSYTEHPKELGRASSDLKHIISDVDNISL